MTQENDIVLIYFEDKPLSFARIEDISPDVKRDWYHVKLLMLQLPLQVVTWILRDVYISGEEFTMNGKRMRLERVVCPDAPPEDAFDDGEDYDEDEDLPTEEISGNGKVISFRSLKKK